MLSLISIALSLLTTIIIPRLASNQSIDEQTEEKQDSFGPQWIEAHRREDGSFVMGYYLPNTNYIDSLKYNKGLDQLEFYFDYRITVIDDGVKIASGPNLQLDIYNSPSLDSFNDCSKSISCAAEMATWDASEDMIRKEKDLSFEEQEDLLRNTFSESNCKIKIFPVESMITYRFRYEPLKTTPEEILSPKELAYYKRLSAGSASAAAYYLDAMTREKGFFKTQPLKTTPEEILSPGELTLYKELSVRSADAASKYLSYRTGEKTRAKKAGVAQPTPVQPGPIGASAPAIHIEETCIVSPDYLLYGLNGISLLGSFSTLLLLIISIYKLHSIVKNK